MKKLPIVSGDEEKTLMPEVLPKPQPNATGSPRQRTVGHMRKILAAAAVAGIAATSARSRAGDASADAPAEGSSDSGFDSMFIGHDPGPDAGGPPDAVVHDSPFIGHDPIPEASPGYDSMFVGHDPAGGEPGSTTSSGCGCDVPGRKGR